VRKKEKRGRRESNLLYALSLIMLAPVEAQVVWIRGRPITRPILMMNIECLFGP
jgi:hypothetical protein